MKLSIVIPVYNEKNTIQEVLQRVRNVAGEKEIIIVDDCSTDGTREILQSMTCTEEEKILFQPQNKGKGAALRTGFKLVSGDIVIIQDADLEYTPEDYPALVKPIMEDRADVVYGSRFLGKPQRTLLTWHSFCNRLLTGLSNMLNGLNLTDMETCYKAFRSTILKSLNLRENRFGFEPEFTAMISKAGYRVLEVAVSYHGRDYSEGKKIGWKDGIAAFYFILRYNLFK